MKGRLFPGLAPLVFLAVGVSCAAAGPAPSRFAKLDDYRVIDGTGHFLMMDRPAEFNTLLANFLSENKLLPS